jgi:phosphatidylinositol kinase/protein kinase (PI-3  family)
MIDSSGHLIHIDFGFVFGLAPGKQFSMETAPWKLTEEMVEVRRFSFTESLLITFFQGHGRMGFSLFPTLCQPDN